MTRRLAVALLLVIAVLPSIPSPVHAALTDRAITWTVNHQKKTITIKGELQIFLGPCRSAIQTAGGGSILTGRDCSAAAADIAKEIKDDIEFVWNRGHHYKCYLLIVIVNIAVVRDRFSVDDDKIGVRIDRMRAGLRSHVSGVRNVNMHMFSDNWNSNDPADRFTPTEDTINGTEFGHPRLNRHTYAHEFGHLLGLHDTYEGSPSRPKPGAPLDLMSRSSLATIDQSTINRVVERNRDRLRDTKGNPVDLDDFVCDMVFRVTFEAGDDYYSSINVMNSAAIPPCRSAPVTASTDQELSVGSASVDVAVVDLISAPGGYALQPLPDPMAAFALSALQVASLRVSYLTLPIQVDVSRYRDEPASGPVPQVYDLNSRGCAEGQPGGADRPDCGARQYRAWISLQFRSSGGLWPSNAQLPAVLAALGSPVHLDRLYRRCSGPTPYPGHISDSDGAVVLDAAMPTRADLEAASTSWSADGRPAKVELNGAATLRRNEPGSLVNADYNWTLTFCPLNADGDPPPNCPS